jgi:hypothetical protein
MIVEEHALELTQTVGTASYRAIFGALTLAFWFVHRRNVRRVDPPPTLPGSKG